MINKKKFDLHIHSTASDGTYSPKEIVERALSIGAVAIALTDHDTIDGCVEISDFAKKSGLELYTGVELNTDAYGAEIDILGYFWSMPYKTFLEMLRKRQAGRIIRAKKIVNRLNDLGIEITYNRVREIAHGSVCRPHVIEAMVEKDYVSDQKEAFEKYLGLGKPAYVPHDELTPEQAIQYISQGGGISVVAHPGLVGNDAIVERLLKEGAQGLEAYYPMHSVELIKKYSKLAEKYNAIVTCGSDSHGPKRKKSFPIGSMTAPSYVLNIFRMKLKEAQKFPEVKD